MKDLLPGDIVIVAKLDRLARSSRDSCLWERAGGIPRPLFGCLMMTIMGGIAEFERGLIRQRCEEGIERAKAKGVTFGRKRKLDAEMIRVAAARYAEGETMAELAEVYGVSEPTIWRALQCGPALCSGCWPEHGDSYGYA